VNDTSSTGANQVIEVTVGSAGDVSVRTVGFVGPSCRDASRFIEQALGERAAETLTGEFYQSQSCGAAQARQEF